MKVYFVVYESDHYAAGLLEKKKKKGLEGENTMYRLLKWNFEMFAPDEYH